MTEPIVWPEGKQFAFTVFDDTDFANLSNVPEVYSLLADLGFRTTKSVWPLKGDPNLVNGVDWGVSCEDADYLAWLIKLHLSGVEIGYHSTTFHRSTRDEIIRGLDRFAHLFGSDPKAMAQHSQSDVSEAIYWGSARLSGIYAALFKILNRSKTVYRGHIQGDEHFWGDVCKARIKYLRNFVYPDINTYKACPQMPYHDPKRPYVNYWFASSEGSNVSSFNNCISEENQDRLEEEGGACIMYTHFASGFSDGRTLDRRFRTLMERLSKKNGWLVPTSTLLDYILESKGHREITGRERARLERNWLLHKIKVRTT